MSNAATGARLGLDPRMLLAASDVEAMVLHKVLEEAVEQRSKERSMFLQNLEVTIHNAVVKAFKA